MISWKENIIWATFLVPFVLCVAFYRQGYVDGLDIVLALLLTILYYGALVLLDMVFAAAIYLVDKWRSHRNR